MSASRSVSNELLELGAQVMTHIAVGDIETFASEVCDLCFLSGLVADCVGTR